MVMTPRADQFAEAEPRRVQALRVEGRTGLKTFGGKILEEWLPELSDRRGREIYREMRDNDPIIGGVVFAIENLIRKVSWRVVPASEANDDVRRAEFVRSAIMDMQPTWVGTVSQILTFLTYGWSFHEIVYKQRRGWNRDNYLSSRFNDRLTGWGEWSPRSQDTIWEWEFDARGHVSALLQMPPPDYQIRRIPIEKAIHVTTTDAKGNPEGRSILRNAYRPWYFKTTIEQIEGIGVERDFTGYPVLFAPDQVWADAEAPDPLVAAAGQETLRELQKIVTSIKRDEQEGLVLPAMFDASGNRLYELILLSAAGQRQFSTTEIIGRYSLQEAMVVLADFLQLGHQKYGSYALAVEKTNIFATAVSAWLDNIIAPVNGLAIPALLRLNGERVENPPQVVHTDVLSIDPVPMVDSLVKLAGIGFNPLDQAGIKEFIMEQLQLPTVAKQGLEAV